VVTRVARERNELTVGWQVAASTPDEYEAAGAIDALAWRAARVPGTVAGALDDVDADLDAYDWWFRVGFAADPVGADEEVVLTLDGLATVAEVYLNGRRILDAESMFATHEIDVGELLAAENDLAICLRALGPRLQGRRRPRARWRTQLVSAANLRFYRTMLLGRAPGFACGPPVVGPWGPVALEHRRGLVLERAGLRARLEGSDGVLEIDARLRGLSSAQLPARLTVTLEGRDGGHSGELTVQPGSALDATARGSIVVPGAEPWWPHTHGRPALYAVRIGTEHGDLYRGRVGFRRLEAAADLLRDGLDLRINGQRVFARGAVWTPLDLRSPYAEEDVLRPVLERVVAAGMNMLRVPGIATYESDAFYDLCDALGILVWQDFMFANLDYPESDPAFMELVEREARSVLDRLGGRPSLAALCGGSEVAQQVAMLGLDPALAHGPLYGELLPRVVAEARVEAPYVPSTPWGGDLPFRTDHGVANYYGVGAYLRPLTDARSAGVRFAAESLAFANVPDEAALDDVGAAVGGSAWKAGVPRDVGAGWDFDDVRDHYLRTLFDVDPVELRSVDPERYLELSRAVTGEVMAETFGEWRRAGSPCRGALVLWLKDLRPGAGWGVLDHRGEPKVAYHHLRRALAPVSVWSTDEGLGGIAVHVANDRSEPLHARLRVALYRGFEQRVDEASTDVDIEPRGGWEGNVETLLGHFADVTWAYRFGPPAQDLVVLTLECGAEVISQSFRYPVGRPATLQPPSRIGLRGRLARDDDGRRTLLVGSDGFAYGVRVHVPGWVAGDDAFSVEPGHERVLELRSTSDPASPPAAAGTLTALNLAGTVRIAVGPD
jgi:beta-mannosidase